jgi:hypothetical protein
LKSIEKTGSETALNKSASTIDDDHGSGAVAIPKPEVPPIMTIRCPSKLRLSEGQAGNFVCCMTKIAGEA